MLILSEYKPSLCSLLHLSFDLIRSICDMLYHVASRMGRERRCLCDLQGWVQWVIICRSILMISFQCWGHLRNAHLCDGIFSLLLLSFLGEDLLNFASRFLKSHFPQLKMPYFLVSGMWVVLSERNIKAFSSGLCEQWTRPTVKKICAADIPLETYIRTTFLTN